MSATARTCEYGCVGPFARASGLRTDVRLAGELPYWAVNLHGLKPKDRISIGSRVFMVLPDISDSDEIGLAVEVEA